MHPKDSSHSQRTGTTASLEKFRINIFTESDDDNGNGLSECDVSDSEEVVRGLNNFKLQEYSVGTYFSKGPIQRRNEGSTRHGPYPAPQQGTLVGASEDIPNLPNVNVDAPSEARLTEGILPSPKLLVLNNAGEYIPLPTSVLVCIDKNKRKFGMTVGPVGLPAQVRPDISDLVDIFFQPDEHVDLKIKCRARVDEVTTDDGYTSFVINKQFIEISPFNECGISVLLEGISDEDLDLAFEEISKQDIEDLMKTYGPNSDSMLMTLCCKRNDKKSIRSQIFALTTRILNESDPKKRQNLVMRNSSGLSALDFTTINDNTKTAMFITEMYFILGQDLYCTDANGNTIVHIMARKGDSVASTLEALFSLKQRDGTKVLRSNVANSKGFLPLHIAARSPRCPQKVVSLLKDEFADGLSSKTFDGSLPIHLSCQYSSDPQMLTFLLTPRPVGINSRRNDGLTPLHLVASRNEASDIKLGLVSLDEHSQTRMIQSLLDHGADRTISVEGYRPVDLLKPDRQRAIAALHGNASHRLPLTLDIASSGSSSGESSPSIQSATNHPEVFVRPGSSSSDSSSAQRVPWSQPMFSPSGNLGSTSGDVSGVASDDSEEDNGGENLEAIAQALVHHPIIQAAIEEAERTNNQEFN